MPLAVGSMCVSCLAIITGAMVPEGIRPWWFIVVATLATIPQSSLQLCIVQMLLDAVPPKNRSLIISIYTMVITLSNSILPLLGVELYQALGGDMRALVLFYSTCFCMESPFCRPVLDALQAQTQRGKRRFFRGERGRNSGVKLRLGLIESLWRLCNDLRKEGSHGAGKH